MPKNTRTSKETAIKDGSTSKEISDDFSSKRLDLNDWIDGLPSGSTKFDVLSDKWFYMYPTASEARYKDLRENHPDIDPIAVSESICELILTEFIEEAVGDIVGYTKGDINGNDGINKSKFQVLCSKCKKYKAATKYGPHFHKCIGIDKVENNKDCNKDNNSKIKLKIKLEETEKESKKDRIPPMIILKKKPASVDDNNTVGIPNSSTSIQEEQKTTVSETNIKPEMHSDKNFEICAKSQQQNDETKLIKSPKYELVTRVPEDESIQHSKDRKAKKIKNLKIKGKKSMFISLDNTLKKSSNGETSTLLESDNKDENNVIVDKLIDSLDKMEIDEIVQDSQRSKQNEDDHREDGNHENNDKIKDNHDIQSTSKANEAKAIPAEVLFALERLGISSELTSELYHEQHNNHDDQDFIDKTFVDFENEILREYYHGNDDTDESNDYDDDDNELVHRKNFPIEIYENISKIFDLYSQKNLKITMGDIVRIVGIVSKRYPLYVCKQIYEQLFSCLNQNGYFQRSDVEIEEIFDTVPTVVPKVFEDYSNRKNGPEQCDVDDGVDEEKRIVSDLETLATLEETIPDNFDAVTLDEFELDCIEDLLNDKVNEDLLESSNVMNFIQLNSSDDQLPDITQQDIEDFLFDAEQNVCNYFAHKYIPASQANIPNSDPFSDSEPSLSDVSASSSSSTSNSSEDYSTKATLNSSSVSSSTRSRTESSSSTISSSTTTSLSNDSFNSRLSTSSTSSDQDIRNVIKSNHTADLNKIPSSSLSSSSSFCSVKCEPEQSDMSDVVKSLDEMSIEMGSSSDKKGESSPSD